MVAESEKGLHQRILSDLRKATLDAFKRNVSKSDADALTKALGQYKAYKTVRPLMDKAEAGVAGRAAGDVPAALLPAEVRKSYGGNIAGSPFSDLSQIGSQFVADRVARTGGSARALFQNSALGTGLALGAWSNPLVPMFGLPAAAGLESLLSSPNAARFMLSNGGAGLLNPSTSLARVAPLLMGDQ
jgi:hypothetical protein